MAKDSTKRLLLYKIEGVEGADAAPTAAANAIVTVGMDATGLNGDTRTRNVDGSYFGARPTTTINITRPLTFGVEVSGSGTTATAKPAWADLLRIAGFDGGVPDAAQVVHSLISANIPSATFWPFIDNLKLPTLGARSTATIVFEDDEIPLFNFSVTGYPPAGFVSEAAPGAPAFAGQAEPLLATSASTTFSLGGYSPGLRRLTIDLGATIAPRSLIGPADRVRLTNREITFEALIEFPDLAQKNYFQSINGALTNFSITHGVAAGNIVQMSSNRVEIGLPGLSDEDNTLMQTVRGRLIPSGAGNNELVIISK